MALFYQKNRKKNTLMCTENINFTSYSGYIDVGDRQYFIRVSNINNKERHRPLLNANLETCEELYQVLQENKALFQKRMKQATSLESFLTEIQDRMEYNLRPKTVQLPPMQYYQRFVEEMDTIGWHHLIELNDTMDVIHLECLDQKQRRHELHVQFDAQYPKIAPLCQMDLPRNEVTFQWEIHFTLKNILEQAQEHLEKYQEFWDVLDDIDKNTWVLEPEKPIKSTTSRRLAMGKHSSIFIDFDPLFPRQVCKIQFLGSDHVISPLREKLNDHLHLWNQQQYPRTNLEQILQITFPSPKSTTKEEFTVECGICYCYKIQLETNDKKDKKNSVIPDRICENLKCSRPFHAHCLFEWLRALPDTKQSFSTIFGNCPYCSEGISVNIVHTLL